MTKGFHVKYFLYTLLEKKFFHGFSWNGCKFELHMLVSLLFIFQKNFSRYKSSHSIRDPPRVLQDSIPIYHQSCPPFWPHFEIDKNNLKNQKKCKTFALHPNLCLTNHTKQQIWNKANNLKKFFKMSYLVWRFMTFKPNDRCYS